MSPEVAKKNAEWFARKKAQREVLALRKAHKKVPPELLEQAGWQPSATPKARKRVVDVPATVRTRSVKATGRVSFKELKAAVKEKWPQVKGLADATYEELCRVLDRGEKEPGVLVELQEAWAKRSRARHEAWLKGHSASAKETLEKKSRGTTTGVRSPH